MAERRQDGSSNSNAPNLATDAVLKPSDQVPSSWKEVQGIDFDMYRDKPLTVEAMLSHMHHTGFQATAVGDAIRIINEMVRIKEHNHEVPFLDIFPLQVSRNK